MKAPVLLLIVYLQLLSTTIAQSVPNGDFEAWSTGLSGRDQPNAWVAEIDGEMLFQEPCEGHTGKYAASLSATWDPLLKVYFGSKISTSFSLQEETTCHALSGYIKGTTGMTDTLICEILIFDEAEIVAFGSYQFVYTDERWAHFEIPITKIKPHKADRITISFFISLSANGHHLTRYCIDDLKLSSLEMHTKSKTFEINQQKT
ncbi:MAG: hypothetical protein KDC05_16395 [Bacteroidales bacterium]|nr:hypothetical protein [Bacteroidales bacterium]